MNIYEKLNTARVELHDSGLKKEGKSNRHKYFELADFLPVINQLAIKHGFTVAVSFGHELATMTITDTAKPTDSITFTSPMSTAKVQGADPVQNLGAVQTYLRRYLYLTAFEIIEADKLEANLPPRGQDKPKEVIYHKTGTGSKPLPTKKADPDEYSLAMSPEQIKSLQTFAIQEYGDERAADAYKWALQSLGIESSALLNKTDYDPVMDALRDYQPLPFGFGDEA